jgi:hypothetical protein
LRDGVIPVFQPKLETIIKGTTGRDAVQVYGQPLLEIPEPSLKQGALHDFSRPGRQKAARRHAFLLL